MSDRRCEKSARDSSSEDTLLRSYTVEIEALEFVRHSSVRREHQAAYCAWWFDVKAVDFPGAGGLRRAAQLHRTECAQDESGDAVERAPHARAHGVTRGRHSQRQHQPPRE
jgi:hypothetical protein